VTLKKISDPDVDLGQVARVAPFSPSLKCAARCRTPWWSPRWTCGRIGQSTTSWGQCGWAQWGQPL